MNRPYFHRGGLEGKAGAELPGSWAAVNTRHYSEVRVANIGLRSTTSQDGIRVPIEKVVKLDAQGELVSSVGPKGKILE
ncbi:hypothetical protein, partial [Pseudomonas sp. FW305-33]|uniref:hypothetical protein n=1 Tax=Pseudomonas sp. FW305-33 TaxID=2751337 RepID=UPI001C44E6E6